MKQLDARNAIRHRDYSRFDKVASFVLLISPIIMTYGWGKYDFAFISTSILAIFSLLKNGFKISVFPRYMLVYILYWFFVHIITATSSAELFSLGIIRVFLCYMMYFCLNEEKFFIKNYCVICSIAIVFFFFQFVSYVLTESRVSGVLTILPLSLEIDPSEYFTKVIYGDRSSSFFSEPAAFVEYILPFLCIQLFREEKVNWIVVGVIIVALLLTESGTAMVGLSAIILMYIFRFIFNSKKRVNKVLFLFFVSIVIPFSIYEYANSEIGQRLLERQDQLDVSGDSYGQSGFVRIYRGLYVFSSFDLREQIIGNDSPSYIKQQISATHMNVDNGMSDELYFNTIQTVLIRTGYIGTLLFVIMLIFLFRISDYCGKSIIIVFSFLSLISSLHFTEVMAIYLLIALYGNVNRTEKLMMKA